MASLAPFFNQQFFDSAGLPVAAGRLHSYDSGTTTPKQAWQDQAGTVTHALPTAGVPLSGITLDAAGRLPGTGAMFLGSGEYTFHLYTSAGVLVKSWDDVGGVESADSLRTDLALRTLLTNGAGLSGHNPALLYPATTVGGELKAHGISITALGASAAASATANVAAINAAISASVAAGVPLIIPGTTGYFDVNDEFTLSDGLTVIGCGSNSKLRQTVSGKNIFILGNDCTVQGVRIVGDGVARTPADFTKENGIFASGKRNVRVESCIISGWQSCGVQLRDCFNTTVVNNLLHGNYWTYPTGLTSASDILSYSGTAGGRLIISNNLCLSDNSQGIFISAQGFDTDCVVGGNICITLDATWALKASASLNRRHGIIAGYGGSASSGRFTVSNNICGNTLVGGIYAAMAAANQSGLTVTGNVCFKNGYAAGGASDASLAGGISVNGGGVADIIAKNTIYDFRGAAASLVGAITYNNSAGFSAPSSSALITGNTIDTSTTHGVVLKGSVRDVVVRGNQIERVTGNDIRIEASADATNGDAMIEGNRIRRINDTSSSIHVQALCAATKRTYVRHNHIVGGGTATAALTNAGIYVIGKTPICVEDNDIRSALYGIVYDTDLTGEGRQFSLLKTDRNLIKSCTNGIVLRSTTSTETFPVEGNIFEGVTTRIHDGGYGNVVGYEAIRHGETITVKSAAVVTAGTWAVGDRVVRTAPVVGQPKAWSVTVAGNPGTHVSEGNL